MEGKHCDMRIIATQYPVHIEIKKLCNALLGLPVNLS